MVDVAAPSLVQQLLSRADEAVSLQSWQEAWANLAQIDHAQLGSHDVDLLLLTATVLRHQGEVDRAAQEYRELIGRFSLQDGGLADAVMGLAECLHLDGKFREAGLLAQAARRIPQDDEKLSVRLASSEAHIRSHLNIEQSIQLFQLLMNTESDESSIWANVYFQYADSLFVGGRFEESLHAALEALGRAKAAGAMVTTADALRRLPLIRTFLGQNEFALRGLGDLVVAQNLYDVAGDRGGFYIHTEEAEVYRALHKYREAERAYRQGLWDAREINDVNRIAHNMLGMFELSRVMGSPLKWKYLEEAESCYHSINSTWGELHCLIAHLLADRKNRTTWKEQALALIDNNSFSTFTNEKQILQRFGSFSHEEIEQYPHLLNYP